VLQVANNHFWAEIIVEIKLNCTIVIYFRCRTNKWWFLRKNEESAHWKRHEVELGVAKCGSPFMVLVKHQTLLTGFNMVRDYSKCISVCCPESANNIKGPLYNFEWFISHTSQPIFADTGNNFISILAVFGDLSEKSQKSCGEESFEIVHTAWITLYQDSLYGYLYSIAIFYV
jgi:hypothetical protein